MCLLRQSKSDYYQIRKLLKQLKILSKQSKSQKLFLIRFWFLKRIMMRLL
ncbi:phosphomethylpyrimidine kinase [Streptococcus parauberis KRS-02109]|nr:phosphomethylpyrimidine kinase [Streptococcus parauberis KRS-02109]